MKSSIEGIVIFVVALRAHREMLHRSVPAIVGQCFDDGESRPAIGAVRERITVSSILGIEHFAKTICAHGNVREDQDSLLAAFLAVADLKLVIACRIEKGELQALDDRARRFLLLKAKQERLKPLSRPFHLNE